MGCFHSKRHQGGQPFPRKVERNGAKSSSCLIAAHPIWKSTVISRPDLLLISLLWTSDPLRRELCPDEVRFWNSDRILKPHLDDCVCVFCLEYWVYIEHKPKTPFSTSGLILQFYKKLAPRCSDFLPSLLLFVRAISYVSQLCQFTHWVLLLTVSPMFPLLLLQHSAVGLIGGNITLF